MLSLHVLPVSVFVFSTLVSSQSLINWMFSLIGDSKFPLSLGVTVKGVRSCNGLETCPECIPPPHVCWRITAC